MLRAIRSLVQVFIILLTSAAWAGPQDTPCQADAGALSERKPAEVAITLDDLPFVFSGALTREQLEQNYYKILFTLDKYKVKAVGFAIGNQIRDSDRELLTQFVNAGHIIGNHTYSHPNFNDLSVDAYSNDIAQGDKALQQWMLGTKYFRFPFLTEGNSKVKRDAIQKFLVSINYLNVPVTIDSEDWRFNALYMDAIVKSDERLKQTIANEYIAFVRTQISNAERMSQHNFRRQVRHIVLLHMNSLNADHLADILNIFRQLNWTFITVGEAIKDPVYSEKDNYYGDRGMTKLEMLFCH
jgi:peptidoglycan/xylan/chitin deacetylase (PgdA/CDA1 family)